MTEDDPLTVAMGYWFAAWTEVNDMWEVIRMIAEHSSEEDAASWYEAAGWGCRVEMAYQRMFGESMIVDRVAN